MQLKKIAKLAAPIMRKNGVIKAGIFGSHARGEAKKKSDVDMLVQFKGRKSYFDLIGLKIQLEKKLGLKVDILTYKSLHPPIKKNVLHEEMKIL